MNLINKIGNWLVKNFFTFTIAGILIVYLRWFWLTPLEFRYYNDPNAAFLVGIILFVLYFVFGILVRLLKRNSVKFTFLALTIMLAFINISHVFSFFPLIENKITCNGRIYYITWMHPFGDYQWTFDELTIWEGLHYETRFFGYSQGPFEIICDEGRGVANIIRTINGVLTYSHGKEKVNYYDWAGTELGQKKYFLAWRCDKRGENTCDLETYTLHECTLDYKSCDSLFISYTTEYAYNLVLEADEKTQEVFLFDDYEDNPERKIIFSYSKESRCYVEGCEILSP